MNNYYIYQYSIEAHRIFLTIEDVLGGKSYWEYRNSNWRCENRHYGFNNRTVETGPAQIAILELLCAEHPTISKVHDPISTN